MRGVMDRCESKGKEIVVPECRCRTQGERELRGSQTGKSGERILEKS